MLCLYQLLLLRDGSVFVRGLDGLLSSTRESFVFFFPFLNFIFHIHNLSYKYLVGGSAGKLIFS